MPLDSHDDHSLSRLSVPSYDCERHGAEVSDLNQVNDWYPCGVHSRMYGGELTGQKSLVAQTRWSDVQYKFLSRHSSLHSV